MSANPAVSDPQESGPAVPVAKRAKVIIDSLDLGNRVIAYYSDGTSEVIEKGRLPSDGSSGSGVSLQTAAISAETAAKQLEEERRQYNETFGYNKARGDQQQQLAQGEAVGYFNGQPTLARDQLNLQKQNASFDYYKWLADTYANPRNIWESLFVRRGQQLPASLAGMGNTDAARAFTGGQPAQAPSFAAAAPQPSVAAPQQSGSPYNPNTDPNRGTMYEGLSGFNRDGTYRLAPNDPDAEKQMAKYPGQYRIGYARGGVTPEPMTAVGDWSGQTYRIGEQGPEGIVPADYLPEFLRSRRGQVMRGSHAYANGGILGFDAGDGGDPYYPDPYANQPTYDEPTYSSTPNDPSNPFSAGFDPYSALTTQVYGPQVPTGYGPTNPQQLPSYTQTTAPAGFHWQGGVLVQDAPTPVAPTPTPTASTTSGAQTTSGGGAVTGGGITTGGGGATGGGSTFTGPLDTNMPPPGTVWDPIRKTYVKVQGEAPPVSTSGPFIQQPTGVPQGNGTVSAAPTVGALMPRDVAAAGTFGDISGNRPTFLPGEDQGGAVSALVAAGILPPFMSRLLGQNRGIQSQGTNQPQRFDLPSDLPLTSSLAASQMSPTERAALESIISSYGIDPADYWAYVQQLSPQGGAAQAPLFGNQFFYGRQ